MILFVNRNTGILFLKKALPPSPPSGGGGGTPWARQRPRIYYNEDRELFELAEMIVTLGILD